MEIRGEKLIIYKDSPIEEIRVIGFIFFLSVFIWMVILLKEFYGKDEGFLFFLGILICLWRIIRISKKIIDVNNKNALVVIEKVGIKYFSNDFSQWNEIKKISLNVDFDKKNICFFMMNNQKLIYEIDDLEVSEFMMLSKFRDHLKIFFENVELNESD